MFPSPQDKNFLIVSIVFHIGILLFLMLGFDRTSLLPVLENTNQNDIISAVVLGDTAKSKILPKQIAAQPAAQEEPKKNIIALKKPDKKKLLELKIKKQTIFAKDLLADIKKQTNKQKLKQKKLQLEFKKTLREQAEKSLRQQLLNEEIKLQGVQSRQSQGEVNKYKALILQAISEHWLVPMQANKHLYCELMIRMAPGGMVLDVQIIKTSGDPSLDSSARAAVLKASPLPAPADPDAFQAFRQFVLRVKPENILES
jgi:colicin import membrane protein